MKPEVEKPQKHKEPEEKEEKKEKVDQEELVRRMEERTKRFEERKKQKKRKLDQEMKEVYSFKPKINVKSQILDNKRTEQIEVPRYEVLHELNYVLKERDAEMMEYKKQIEEEKFQEADGKECTFKPHINNYKTKINNQGTSIEERTKIWQEKKQLKIDREK